MTRIIVDIPEARTYEVLLGSGILSTLGQELHAFESGSQVVVITDTEVGSRYEQNVKAVLEAADYRVSVITVPAGEGAKSTDCAAEIWDAMAACGLSRDSLVVALGGGVIGDLAGFTASTFMRGISVVQVPTTLLSMVDSAVGGKTAINLAAGKNLVGTFCQPRLVCADIETLHSLPEREWACGCGEIAKTAVIDSDEFFFWLVDNADALSSRDTPVVREAVKRCVVFKASVVAQDQTESCGVRECLNYGHTLAHAIEVLAGYGTYSHGHAVAQGMRFAARLGAQKLGASLDFIKTQDALLDALGLPEITFKAKPEEFLGAMKSDKKVRAGQLRFVLPADVGKWEVLPLEDAFVLENLAAWQNSEKF